LIARLLIALFVVSGCGRVIGMHDFSAANGNENGDARAYDTWQGTGGVDVLGEVEADVNASREEAGAMTDGAIIGTDVLLVPDTAPADRAPTDTASLDIAPLDAAPSVDGPPSDAFGSDTKRAEVQDTAPDRKTCPALTWQWAITSILANAGRGACSYEPATLPAFVAAIDNQGFDQARGCGTCLRLVPGRTDVITTYVDVLVVDTAGTSDSTRQLSISSQAMDAIAVPGTQNIGLNFAVVPCPTALVGSSIQVTRQQGSTPQHLAVLTRNQPLPLRAVDVWFASSWNAMTLAPYNYWIFDSTGVSPPYSFRMTNSLGDILTVNDMALTSSATADGPFVDTNVQFPSCVP
jgi:expansin (peptidoglycan-binding protein)